MADPIESIEETVALVSEPSQPVPVNDTLANQEADLLFEERDRDNQVKRLFHNLILWALRIIFLVLVIVFLIRVAHFILPTSWRWLSDVELQTLDKFFFSGALGGIISRNLNKITK